MKKAIAGLTICLLLLACKQTAQAQTKEETIRWIKDKLYADADEDEDVASISIYEVQPCDIRYRLHLYNGDYIKIIIHLSPNVKWSVSTTNEEAVEADTEVGTMSSTKRDKTASTKRIYMRTKEENIRARFAKALNHLSSFCSEAF